MQGSAAAEGGAQVRLQDVVQASGSRPLSIACADLDPAEAVRVFTPTFNPRDVDRMLTYDLLASPTLKPGRTTRAHVKAVRRLMARLKLRSIKSMTPTVRSKR